MRILNSSRARHRRKSLEPIHNRHALVHKSWKFLLFLYPNWEDIPIHVMAMFWAQLRYSVALLFALVYEPLVWCSRCVFHMRWERCDTWNCKHNNEMATPDVNVAIHRCRRQPKRQRYTIHVDLSSTSTGSKTAIHTLKTKSNKKCFLCFVFFTFIIMTANERRRKLAQDK